jgi:hypothetical protein
MVTLQTLPSEQPMKARVASFFAEIALSQVMPPPGTTVPRAPPPAAPMP